MNTTVVSFRRALLPLALLGFVSFTPAASAASDAPIVNVSVPNDGEALAAGYEKAFERFKGGPIYLTYEKEGAVLRTLAGIRSLRADGAVVFVVTEKGSSLAIPAKRVLVITDERPQMP